MKVRATVAILICLIAATLAYGVYTVANARSWLELTYDRASHREEQTNTRAETNCGLLANDSLDFQSGGIRQDRTIFALRSKLDALILAVGLGASICKNYDFARQIHLNEWMKLIQARSRQ